MESILAQFVTAVFQSFALARATHDVNGQNPALMPGQQVINKITDDRIRFVAEFGHDAANQRITSSVPFEIDRAMSVDGAVKLCPSVRAPWLFGPDLNELEFSIQLRVAHDLTPQGSAPGRDHMDDRLHL